MTDNQIRALKRKFEAMPEKEKNETVLEYNHYLGGKASVDYRHLMELINIIQKRRDIVFL